MKVTGATEYEQLYDSSQMQQLLGMIALREQRALNVPGRGSSQLAALGKLKAEHKLRSFVPKTFEGIAPDSHSFTCETVFQSLLPGEFPLIHCLARGEVHCPGPLRQ
eukprot:1907433-Pleurochrysis_carterae.AAC.1